jgi:site-specific DNA recombinase
MRLLLAARLSQLAKGQTGIDTQDEDARYWASDAGHQIVATVADRKSGPTAMWDRPNLRPWVTDPELMALYDGIVAAKQDRLSRADWSDEARIRLWAEEHGKTLFIVDRNLQWPPRTPDDRERWNNGAEQARREWENTSKRYRRAQTYLRSQAFFVGKKPYGFRIVTVPGSGRTPEDDHKTLEPDPVTGPIVRSMAKRYLDGQSFRQIRDWLVSESIPVPQQPKDANGDRKEGNGWTAQAVRRILSNPAIAGRLQTNGQTALRMEPLISLEQFQQIQNLRKSRATRGTVQHTALLTSILVCKDGNPMYRVSNRDGEFYYCAPDKCARGNRVLIPLAYMDTAVNDAVMAMADMPHLVIKTMPADDHSNEIAQIKQDISELDPEATTYDYDAELAKRRAEIARLRELDRNEAKPLKRDINPDGKTVGEIWESLDTAGRRQWLLARNGRVQVSARDRELGVWITDIDLGEYTDAAYSLATLKA